MNDLKNSQKYDSNGKQIAEVWMEKRRMYEHPFISSGSNFVDHKEVCRRKGLIETEVCPVEYGRDKHIILPHKTIEKKRTEWNKITPQETRGSGSQ